MLIGFLNWSPINASSKYYAAQDSYYADSSSSGKSFSEQEVDLSGVDFDGLSIMPVSCIQ